MSWFEGTRARLRLLFSPHTAESRMDDEIRFHVEMETERLVRDAGLNPREARRRALIAVGAFVLSGGDGQLVTALSPAQLGLLAVYAALMFGVCLLTCIVPTQRALRVEPTEALRAE